jgi:hypothetical protein
MGESERREGKQKRGENGSHGGLLILVRRRFSGTVPDKPMTHGLWQGTYEQTGIPANAASLQGICAESTNVDRSIERHAESFCESTSVTYRDVGNYDHSIATRWLSLHETVRVHAVRPITTQQQRIGTNLNRCNSSQACV